MNWTAAAPESSGEIRSRNVLGCILNCPAGAPFHKTLAEAVLNGEIFGDGAPAQHDLPSLTIYVPAISAVVPLKRSFLDASANGATFLPRILVLGESEPLEMLAAFSQGTDPEKALHLLKRALDVPGAFSPLERQLALTPLVLKAASNIESIGASYGERLFANISPASAFTISESIALLLQEAHTEGVNLGTLEKLGKAGDGSEQLAQRLLRDVLKAWRSHKVKAGKIDAEDRRNRLMQIEAEFIAASSAPVIVAGSTGSVAATLSLMQAALSRENGAVVLAGLDRDLDGESWCSIAKHPEHAQHGFQQLLARLCIPREAIEDLKTAQGSDKGRATFLSEALRPASTAAKWCDYLDRVRGGTAYDFMDLSLIETENTQAEAETIGLILREVLDHPGRTAALVTPDNGLFARVRHCLARWQIPFADAGSNAESNFEAHIAATAAGAQAEDLLALLRHAPGISTNARRLTNLLDLGALRQMWRASNLKAIPVALARTALAASRRELSHPAIARITEEEWEQAAAFSKQILQAFAPLLKNPEAPQPFNVWLSAHHNVVHQFAFLLAQDVVPAPHFIPAPHVIPAKAGIHPGVNMDPRLRGDDDAGDVAEASIFGQVARLQPPAFSTTLAEYAQLFSEIARQTPKSPPECLHPRLFFWRPLDARLMSADVIVLAGLNEGCWPRNSEPDPWLSRSERAFLGLSPPERRMGQSAQDFAALAVSGAQIVMTRSRMVNGSLARPSRWVSRIKALADGAGFGGALKPPQLWQEWARLRRERKEVRPAARPEPRPPVAVRPRRLSVTAIETWFANPYAIYARHILKLEPLRRLNEGLGAREKGILLHAAMHAFFEEHPGALPSNSSALMIDAFENAAREHGVDLASAPFWRPRFARFAHWFAAGEAERRRDVIALHSEVRGRLPLPCKESDFLITARADRIDLMRQGGIRIFDFKTSKNTVDQSLKRNAPQLALEGLLAREGAFENFGAAGDIELAYVVATGAEPPGDIRKLRIAAAQAIDEAREGLIKLADKYDDPATPYFYGQRAIFAGKNDYDPYALLARVKEWSSMAAGEDGDD